jgi:hypothetical protein
MNPNPAGEVREEENEKLPVLHNKRDPAFNKDFVHVIFFLGKF